MSKERNSRAAQKAGYSLGEIYAFERVLRPPHAELEELPEGEADLNLVWDWRIPDVESVIEGIPESGPVPDFYFEIALGVELSPSQKRPEAGRTTLVGRFPFDPQEHSVKLLDFVRLHGVATLYPYLRQAVAELTQLSLYGVFHLPILNISGLMEGFDIKVSTGWNQLSKHSELTEALEIELPDSEQESGASEEETSDS